MLEALKPFINRASTHKRFALIKWESYLDKLKLGTDRLVDRNGRFVTDPIPSKGIDFLNSLIVRADIPYLLKHTDDFSRLSRITTEYNGTMYSAFLRQYAIKTKAFIYSDIMTTTEYCLITEDFNMLDELPMGINDTTTWLDRVKPIRMITNDSKEIQLDIITSRLKYRYTPPLEAVFSVNVVKLLMLYTKYRQLNKNEFLDNDNNYPFIYKACILPLLHDNVKTWITTIIHDMIDVKLADPKAEYDMSLLSWGNHSNFVLNGLDSALRELENLINKCVDGAVKPDEILASLYTSPGMSLFDDINWLMDSNYVSGETQYSWTSFVREYYLLSIMLKLFRMYGDSNRGNELKRLFGIMAKRAANTRFYQHARNPFLIESLETKFNSLLELIE